MPPLQTEPSAPASRPSAAIDDPAASARDYQRCEPSYWAIHGRYYDLAPFVGAHPGGTEMILLGRGHDCTELFEAIHSLSHIDIHAMLSKYEVTDKSVPPAPQEMFSFQPDGFYATLARRVKAYFDARGGNHKATSRYWAQVAVTAALWLAFYVAALQTGSVASAVASAVCMSSLLFCVLHDGSHYAISRRPWVNRLAHTLLCDWAMWSHWIWMRHHVYGHHSFTGVYERDPDLINVARFVRKTAEAPHKPVYETQHWHRWLMVFLPNQHIGQALVYLVAMVRGQLWRMNVNATVAPVDVAVLVVVYAASLLWHFYLPFHLLPASSAARVVAAYWAAIGVAYFCNVFPNHDTNDSHANHATIGAKHRVNGKVDWGVQQVVYSGNHSTDGGLWSRIVSAMYGGMNYQIEHHLFPAVSHVHYPAVSKIVQQTCREFHLPYVTHSWLQALFSFTTLLHALSLPSTKTP